MLGQEIVAVDADSFSWDSAADVQFVKGGLATVASYGVFSTGSLPLVTMLVDPDQPSQGTGFYYLVRPDCPVGSWQSSLGAEPGRDASLP